MNYRWSSSTVRTTRTCWWRAFTTWSPGRSGRSATTSYEEALGKTSTKHAPWFVIPANHKWFRNLPVSKIMAVTLESLEMRFPVPTVKIEDIRCQYHMAEESEKNVKK